MHKGIIKSNNGKTISLKWKSSTQKKSKSNLKKSLQ
jgi:hypothetical protein